MTVELRSSIGKDLFSSLRHAYLSSLTTVAIIELKLIGVTSDLDAVAVGIEKTDRPVAGDHQSLRPANDGNLAPPQNRMELVDDVIRVDVDAKMVHLRHAFTRYMSRTLRQSLQRDVVMLLAVAQESHLGLQVTRGDLQAENGAIKFLGLFEVSDIENDVAERAVPYNHFSTINRLIRHCQDIRRARAISQVRFEAQSR